MKIETVLQEPHNVIGLQAVPKDWNLWFVLDDEFTVEQHRLPAKPTKRQVRKLRKQFRKSLLNECSASGANHRWVTETVPSEFITGREGEEPTVLTQCEYCGCLK